MPRNVVTCRIEGLDQIQRKLEQTAPNLMKAAMRKALTKAGKLMAAAIAEEAPEESGFLHEHIKIKARIFGHEVGGQVKVGASDDKYPELHRKG